MGNNYKFRLSWLYSKLRDPRTSTNSTSKSRTNSSSPRVKPPQEVVPPAPGDPNPRKSYHFTRELAAEHSPEGSSSIGTRKEPPRVEVKPGRHVSYCSFSSSTSTSNATSCSSPPRHRRPRRSSLEFRFDRVLTPDPVEKTTSSSSTSSSSASRSLSDADVVVGGVNLPGLPPILTTTKKKKKKKVAEEAGTERRRSSSKRLFLSTSAKSPGMRIRAHSPRLLAAARRSQARKCSARQRRTYEETDGKCTGVAVVKSSFDPWRDFRDSMVEMIVENRIKESEDLEDLLVCYLSLNSEEYHEVIIAAFKQIWCDLTDVRLNERT